MSRDVDDVLRLLGDLVTSLGRDRKHLSTPGAYLGEVRQQLGQHAPSVATHTTGVSGPQQGDRAVLHLAGRVRVRRHVGDFLQFQSPLERDRQTRQAPEVKEEGTVEPGARRVHGSVDRPTRRHDRSVVAARRVAHRRSAKYRVWL